MALATLLHRTCKMRNTPVSKISHEKPRMRYLKAFVVATACVAIAVYLGIGIHYAKYSPHSSNAYVWAVYHVHSTMSDGLQSPVEIAQQARAAGVSLVLLTDHGSPNLASSGFHEIIADVTIVGGSEASLPDGRLTFFGAQKIPQFRLSSFPPAAIDDAQEWGAFPVLAYPDDPRYHWRYWNSDLRPGGIEVLNLFTSLRSGSWTDRLLLAMYYPFSRYYFLKKITVPPESIAHWDALQQRDKTWGLAASDAHGGFRITPWLSIKLPSYADTFSFAGMGIDRKYQSDPEAAIRNGDFFNCIRGAAEPERFEFSAYRGFQKFPSGSDAPAHSDLHVEVRAGDENTRLVLRKDGAVLREIVGDHLDLENAAAGVYRVEVFLVGHPLLQARVPWILSNPIFVGLLREPRPPRPSVAIRAQLPKNTNSYKR